MNKCPKCDYVRTAVDDPEIPYGRCPGCGVFYEKYRQYMKNQRGAVAVSAGNDKKRAREGAGARFMRVFLLVAVTLFLSFVLLLVAVKPDRLAIVLPSLGIVALMVVLKRMGDRSVNVGADGVQKASIPATHEDKLLAYAELQHRRTGHLLHFFVSVLTVGVWVFVWLLIAASNIHDRNVIRRRYQLPAEENTPILLLGFFTFAVIGLMLWW